MKRSELRKLINEEMEVDQFETYLEMANDAKEKISSACKTLEKLKSQLNPKHKFKKDAANICKLIKRMDLERSTNQLATDILLYLVNLDDDL